MAKSTKFLVGKSLRSKEKGKISSEQVSLAIQNFRFSGGLIKQLPPEEVLTRNQVGNSWTGAFEKVLDW